MIWRPIGKPSRLNPQGTEIAGTPYVLNGETFRATPELPFNASSIVSGGATIVGTTSRSTPGVAMGPGLILDRVGLILLGLPHLHVLGFVLLSIGTALYAAGMSSVKAVKLSMKLETPS